MSMQSDYSIHDFAPVTGQNAPAPYCLKPPAGTHAPFVFAVPHSGRYYPPGLLANSGLSMGTLRLSEDAYVDKLFAKVPEMGAGYLIATHARTYLDLNRAANELDPGMFTPRLAADEVHQTHRVNTGLGLIPRLVTEGQPIYKAPLPAREAFHRINAVHRPYHEKLQSLLRARTASHSYAVLVDCHSMPAEGSTSRHCRSDNPYGPDIILGDCWGTSCHADLTALAEELLTQIGFSVHRNVPYAGGYVTKYYGKPSRGTHALQIEINRAIYMNQKTLEPLTCFEDVQKKMTLFSEKLIREGKTILEAQSPPLPRAAE